ncbi:non-canonical purine NTP pyrophosphatase [Algisphaera agarilytica]|uniref:dITP/XTP pyrophosphatase n=1 Tax=Algisphaera agarilytica TaxID=1385975 RepID=A0A7X0H8A1_9BACT|nr:non-canonical purine NTP pyrophosphatase [Algisphaera agarilytica]MBB6429951.1 XTP/dITP diphosphohydrolase [Algisphaera agarilytica]
MQVVLATSNPHKLEEIRSVFDGESLAQAIDWKLFSDLDPEYQYGLKEPVEDQPTFEGNAALKARHYAKFTDKICLADDSGIEVDALGGAPGVISARYSGVRGPRTEVDPANNVKLLEELQGVPIEKRTARFVCAMCLFIPGPLVASVPGAAGLVQPGDEHVQLIVRGTVEGRIILPEEAADPASPEKGRGTNGFGYDPLFVLPDDHEHAGLTTAQLEPSQKNAISHRGHASRLLLEAMKAKGLL